MKAPQKLTWGKAVGITCLAVIVAAFLTVFLQVNILVLKPLPGIPPRYHSILSLSFIWLFPLLVFGFLASRRPVGKRLRPILLLVLFFSLTFCFALVLIGPSMAWNIIDCPGISRQNLHVQYQCICKSDSSEGSPSFHACNLDGYVFLPVMKETSSPLAEYQRMTIGENTRIEFDYLSPGTSFAPNTVKNLFLDDAQKITRAIVTFRMLESGNAFEVLSIRDPECRQYQMQPVQVLNGQSIVISYCKEKISIQFSTEPGKIILSTNKP